MSQQLIVRYLSNDQDVNPGRSYSESAPVLTQSWSLKHPVGPGAVGQVRRLSADGTTLEWFTPSNVAASSVGAFLVYAGPSTPGYPENPQFVSLTPGYIPNLPASQITSGVFDISLLPVGTSVNSVAAGNDVRFHTQNTDLGTTSPTFKVGIGTANEVLIKATATGFEFRNAADTDYADFRAANVITGNTVEIGDNKIVLNSDVTGAPTEDGGISVNRGPSDPAAELVWVEADKEWVAGAVGFMYAVSRRRLFTVNQAQINVAGGHAITHNLRTYVKPTCYMPDGTAFEPIGYSVAADVITIDFTGLNVGAGVVTVRIDG